MTTPNIKQPREDKGKRKFTYEFVSWMNANHIYLMQSHKEFCKDMGVMNYTDLAKDIYKFQQFKPIRKLLRKVI